MVQSKSKYTTNNQQYKLTFIFQVGYLNPCVLPSYVYIVGPTDLGDEDYLIN